MIYLAKDRIETNIEAQDLLGDYSVTARVHDRRSKTQLELVDKFTVKELLGLTPNKQLDSTYNSVISTLAQLVEQVACGSIASLSV